MRSSTAAAAELPLHTMARVYTAQAVHEITLLAAECFGAMGVMRDMPLQKYVHDAMVFLHADDSDEAAKLRDRRSDRRLRAACASDGVSRK